MAWPVLKINDVTAENMRAEIDAREATVQTLHSNYRTDTGAAAQHLLQTLL